ncbi:hypothetical protein HDF16_004643 [Granulicella aggregans]|uniref:Uncharacterized protein n=1 Tax=Granulicella aggregans TaxID=474949 RepID=A0A7W7ZHZ6_9BACT|nr:hypothetical protein [Granulicella aggregans]
MTTQSRRPPPNGALTIDGLSVSPKIMNAETSEGGVMITFDEGSSVIFSSSLLYEIYLEAQRLQEFQDIH